VVEIKVIVGPKTQKRGIVRGNQLKFRGYKYLIENIASLDVNAGAKGGIRSGLTGAFVGGELGGRFGAEFGALVGTMVGRKNQTAFVIRSITGEQFVCVADTNDYLGILAEIVMLPPPSHEQAAERGLLPEAQVPFNLPLAIIGGPIYSAKFGLLPFAVAAAITVATGGIGWFFAWIVSAAFAYRAFLKKNPEWGKRPS
jgi:hypothetical protein